MKPQQLLPPIRRVVLLLSVLGLLYLFWRFEFMRLPEDRCSPLLNTPPGTTLLFDTRSRSYELGDIVLYETPTAAVAIGLVQKVEAGADGPRYWIITNDPDCAVPDSEDWGWIDGEQLQARLLLSGFI